MKFQNHVFGYAAEAEERRQKQELESVMKNVKQQLTSANKDDATVPKSEVGKATRKDVKGSGSAAPAGKVPHGATQQPERSACNLGH